MPKPGPIHGFLLLLHLLYASGDSQVTVDDADPSVIYGGTWKEDTPSEALDKTLRYSSTAGSTATVHFSGTQIQVYGAFGPNDVAPFNVSASFDVGAGILPGSYTNQGPPAESQFHFLAYTSPILPMGEYTLVVTNQADYFWIDYFMYTVPDSSTSPSQAPSTDSSTKASQAPPASPSQPTLISSTPSATASATALSSFKPHEGSAINGGQPQTSDVYSMSPSNFPSSNTSSQRAVPTSSPNSFSPFLPSNPSEATAKQTVTLHSDAFNTTSHKFGKAAIGGIAAGCLFALLVATAAVVYWRRRSSQKALSHVLPYTTETGRDGPSISDPTSSVPGAEKMTLPYVHNPGTQIASSSATSENVDSRISILSQRCNRVLSTRASNGSTTQMEEDRSLAPSSTQVDAVSKALCAYNPRKYHKARHEAPRQELDGGVQLQIVEDTSLSSEYLVEDHVGTLPPAYGEVSQSTRTPGRWIFHPVGQASLE